MAAAETIAELDGVFARGRFARDFDAAMPEFSRIGELRLEAARHPVLEDKLQREQRAIVPMTLALGGAERVLVISGPNTGGKTVALKTTGLAALAAQSGIPVAAQRAVLPIFDRVLVDIGDEQSIAADLSTFSAHMLNLKSMLATATPKIRWCWWTRWARERRRKKARRWRWRCSTNFARRNAWCWRRRITTD